jgi:hypothetical protein
MFQELKGGSIERNFDLESMKSRSLRSGEVCHPKVDRSLMLDAAHLRVKGATERDTTKRKKR